SRSTSSSIAVSATRSRWTRFFTILSSGTSVKNSVGRSESSGGSTSTDGSSSGSETPSSRRRASSSSSYGATDHPSAADQNRARGAASTQSKTTESIFTEASLRSLASRRKTQLERRLRLAERPVRAIPQRR